jgi:hypothetical protein
MSTEAGSIQASKTYILQKLLQLIMFPFLNQHMLVVDIFDNEGVAMLLIYPHDDGLDGGIALDQDAFIIRLAWTTRQEYVRADLALLAAFWEQSRGGRL